MVPVLRGSCVGMTMQAEVRKLLNGPDKVAALHAALRDPPLTTKNEALKVCIWVDG